MIDLIRTRRSIRKYTNKNIEAEKISLLKEVALLSPTSRNLKPCQFAFVQDKEVLAKLSTAKEHGSFFLKDSALAIVVCANEKKSDVWIEDACIATTLLQMQAQSLGLGSCWIQIRNRNQSKDLTSEAYVQDILGLDKFIRIEAVLSIGYAAEQREPAEIDDLELFKVKDI